MKKIQMVSCTVFVVVAAMSTQAAEYAAADDNPISTLCVSAAVDKPLRFFGKVRDIGVSKAFVANNITCNGMNITSFAQQAGNDGNYQRLSHYRRGHVEINDLAQAIVPTPQLITIRGQLNDVAGP